MYPELFKINSFQIDALTVFIVLGLFVFGINLWKGTRELKNFAFDLFLLNLILNPVVARMMHILLNPSTYEGYGWSFLPIKDTGEGLQFFTTFPWVFVSFWEKGMNFQFMPLVLVISLVILLQFKRGRLSELPLGEIWKSFIMGFVLILFGFFLDGSYLSREFSFPLLLRYKGQSVDLFPIQLLELVLLLFCLIFYLDNFRLSNTKIFENLRNWLFPLYWAIVQIGIWFLLASYSKDFWILDTAQIVWGGLIVIILLSLYFRPRHKNPELGRFGNKVNLSGIQSRRVGSSQEADYSYSFSDYRKGVKPRMSAKEKLKQTRNRIKRGI